MTMIDLEALARHGAPAVSVLVPLDERQPGNWEDALRLRRLVEAAESQLEAVGAEGKALAAPLRKAADSVDLTHPSAGIGIFVSPDHAFVAQLGVRVPERVVVGAHFAVSELLEAWSQLPDALVLLLSQRGTRLIDTQRGEWREHTGDGFPVGFEPPVQGDAPHRDFPIGERERAEADRKVFEAVDAALARALYGRDRAVVVVGSARELARFSGVTAHDGRIVARVVGNLLHADLDEVARVVGPALRAGLAHQTKRVAKRYADAVGSGAVAGLDAAAAAADAGRGHELVLETGRDDADGVIEAVLAHGGHVQFVERGTLDDYDGVVLALRY